MHPMDGYKSISMVSLDFLEINENKLGWSEHVKLLITPYLIQDGMNEYGLGVAVTGAPCRIGANLPNVPKINSSSAMRIILDEAKSVDEALLILEKFDLYFQNVCGHHLLADVSGNAAVVEYIDGDMIITRTEHPWQIATNFLMNEYQPVADEGPCWRYRKIAEILGQHHGKITSQKAMQVLESISTRTIWSVVYNLTTGSVEISLGRNYKMMYTLSLDMQFEIKYWLKSQQASLIPNLSR